MTHRLALIALAASVLAAGCLGGADVPAEDASFATEQTDAADVDDVAHAYSGTITGTPVAPGEQVFTFDVPKGATAVNATLTWEGAPVTALGLNLFTPRDEAAGRGFPESEGRLSVATVDPPASGEWKAVVSSTRALDAPFDLAVTVSFLVPKDNVLSDTTEVAAGDFVELNLIMEGNATFDWEFDASGDVEWNIHTHENGETRYVAQGTGSSYAGNFTATKRQIYSILFESLSPSPITLSYRVDGEFRVHSHSQ